MLPTPLTAALLASAAPGLQTPPGAVPPPNVTVVDAKTGAPVPGARVHQVPEAAAPVWGAFWSAHDAAPTDPGGRTWLPEGRPAWTIARADGYAPFGTGTTPRQGAPLEIAMWPVVPAELEVLDFEGNPLPLVRLGVAVGCGHTPDVTAAFTDHVGRATLLAVGEEWDIADVFPVGPSVLTDYLDVDWSAATSGGYRTVALPGATLEGVLLQADGTPCVGYAVGQMQTHRGPWAITDERGRFLLYGVQPQICDPLMVKEPAGETIGEFERSRVGVKRVLRLGEEPWADELDGASTPLTVTIVEGDHPFEGRVPIAVWNVATGMCLVGSAGLGEDAEFLLPPGTFAIHVGGQGSPFPELALDTLDAPTASAEWNPVVHAPEALRFEIAGIGEATSVDCLDELGTATELAFDGFLEDERGRVGVIEAFAPPAGRWALWLPSNDPHRSADVVDLEPRSGGVVRGRRRP